ncbi:ZZ-type zinc finger-containing protein 3-like isoform X2 [Anthonomus grandis grandis]|uniref:ZZ-type zinc finger-containing protein 3-like isoform X2 n=1 Tax=Anthonomus grandis grandis TaxID=2921223 RepID=UPI0021651638|nr:ZZ-type zinc finger-containing protein 3-like isoform X2 [Anthonomus grandis grandis]
MDDLAPPFKIEDDLFQFETEHLALRGNEDYCNVLKTLVILDAQREQALLDFKTVSELRVEALRNPFETLEKIKSGEDLGVPPLFELPKLPKIDFSKFKVPVDQSDLDEIYSDGPPAPSNANPEFKNPNNGNNNRAWTPEEQKRLEELLQIYPPEPVEARRFHKIAQALGNRTVQQVASRIQKYFVKLYKAGLPIPGRIPKSAEKHRKSSLHKHQRHNHYLFKPTTFFPELSVPVQMDTLDDIPGPFEGPSTSAAPTEANYLMKNDYHQDQPPLAQETGEISPESQLKLLKRLKDVKVQECSEGYIPFSHEDFRCDYCDESPILGARWHCTVCAESVDFCTDCVVSQMYSEAPHPFHHWLSVYMDGSEKSDYLLRGFAEPSRPFEKQIEQELKSKEFGVDGFESGEDTDSE